MFDYRASNTFNYFSELNPERRALIRAVQAQQQGGAHLEQLLGVQKDAVDDASSINSDVFDAPLMAAIERFGPGDLYRAMEFETLPTGAQRRLLENGIIVSSMFGLLRPDDLIPDYRLDIDASIDGLGKVTEYWRDVVSPHIDRLVEDRIVWNLLPGDYAGVWNDGGRYDRMYRVSFVRHDAGSTRPEVEAVPELMGSLVHFIVERLAETPEALLDWDAPGGFEPAADEFELDERGGTLVYAHHDDWMERRAVRHEARAAKAAPRPAPEEEGEE
jgi:cytoplasmic iron level regulating protein YaaA (DUF328/UPF0246 family)